MLAELPAKNFREWQHVYQMCPFGPEAEELRLAIVAQQVVLAAGPKHPRACTLEKFMPSRMRKGKVRRRQSPAQQIQIAKTLAARSQQIHGQRNPRTD